MAYFQLVVANFGQYPECLVLFQCKRPTKYELVINLTTAKALALTVLPTLLATTDEVIGRGNRLALLAQRVGCRDAAIWSRSEA